MTACPSLFDVLTENPDLILSDMGSFRYGAEAQVRASLDERYIHGFATVVNTALASSFIDPATRTEIVDRYEAEHPQSVTHYRWLDRMPDMRHISADKEIVKYIGRTLGYTLEQARSEYPAAAHDAFGRTSLYMQLHGRAGIRNSVYHNDVLLQTGGDTSPSDVCPFETTTFTLMVGIGKLISAYSAQIAG